MASKSKFRHEDIGTIPAGYKVRTVIHPSGHRVRIAFPPGPRRKGTGQIVSVLHPLSGANPCPNPCENKFDEWVKNPEPLSPVKKVVLPVTSGWALSHQKEVKKYVGKKRAAELIKEAKGKGKNNPCGNKFDDWVKNPEPLSLVKKVVLPVTSGWALSHQKEVKKYVGKKRAAELIKEAKGKGKNNPCGNKFDDWVKNPPLTKADVEAGRIYYVKDIDRDARLTRFHGPFTLEDAYSKSQHFKKVPGHTGQMIRTPDPALAAVRRRKNPHGKHTRLGRPIVARGASESDAYDKLAEAIDRRNPKGNPIPFATKGELHAYINQIPASHSEGKWDWNVVIERGWAPGRTILKSEKVSGGRQVAEAYARRLLKEAKQNPAKKKNLDEIQDAQKVYEKFQGEAGSKVTTFDEPAERRDDFAKLGALVEIIAQPEGDPIDGKEAAKMWSQANDNDPESVQNGEIWETIAEEFGVELVRLSFRKDKAWLCSDAHGTQLYNIGGSQNLDPVLGKFGADATKDLCDLGWCIAVCYLAAKAHDDHQLLEHVHHLGEEGGMPPRLQYNRLQHRLFYVGGTYRIEAPGIVN